MHHHEPECMQKDLLAVLKVKVTARAHMIKLGQFLLYLLNCIFYCYQTVIVHYHKPWCHMAKLDCCVLGQGHSKISKCLWMFVQMIPPESLNLLQQNLAWWCIIVSQIVFQKDWFAVFKVKITVKDHIIKIWLSNVSSELPISLQLNLIC